MQSLLQELIFDIVPARGAVKQDVSEIVRRRFDAFPLQELDSRHTKLVEHRIETRKIIPFKQSSRAIPYARRKFILDELETLLALGVLSAADPGVCPYASPMVVVPKIDGGFRICVDYRQGNQQTVPDQYPFPRIEEIFIELLSAHCVVFLDLHIDTIKFLSA